MYTDSTLPEREHVHTRGNTGTSRPPHGAAHIYVCLCIYMYMYMYMTIHIYLRVCVYIYVYVYICTQTAHYQSESMCTHEGTRARHGPPHVAAHAVLTPLVPPLKTKCLFNPRNLRCLRAMTPSDLRYVDESCHTYECVMPCI